MITIEPINSNYYDKIASVANAMINIYDSLLLLYELKYNFADIFNYKCKLINYKENAYFCKIINFENFDIGTIIEFWFLMIVP